MRSALQREKWWLIANALAIGLYLLLESTTWGEPDDISVVISRTFMTLPIGIVMGLADLIWFGLLVVWLTTRRRGWLSLLLPALVPLAWAAAYGFDRAHWGVPVPESEASRSHVGSPLALIA